MDFSLSDMLNKARQASLPTTTTAQRARRATQQARTAVTTAAEKKTSEPDFPTPSMSDEDKLKAARKRYVDYGSDTGLEWLKRYHPHILRNEREKDKAAEAQNQAASTPPGG